MALKTAGLQTHIWNNNARSFILLATYPVMMMALTWIIAAIFSGGMGWSAKYGGAPAANQVKSSAVAVDFANNFIAQNWLFVIGIIALWFCVAYLFHTKMIRSLCHSTPVTRKEEPKLYNLLENMCISRGLITPVLEIIETDALNAFASGINTKTYTITVTRGLINTLDDEEIEGVLAHELSHIMNNDVRLLIISVIFTGMVGFAAQMTWSMIRHNLFYGNRRNKNGGRLVIILMIIAIVLWAGYIATLFTRFALSRSREYMADAGAIELTKNPDAMMRALMKISGKDRMKDIADDIALMCIENSHAFLGMFATHPPIDKRIEAISETTGTPIPVFTTAPEKASNQSGRTADKNPWI